MSYVLVGVNHKTAPVALREKLSLDADKIRGVQLKLLQSPEIDEVAVLSTCNRVEFYSSTQNPEAAQNQLQRILCEPLNQIEDKTEIGSFIYVKYDDAVVTHLFEVASSLDSQVTGENQITGQVKTAHQQALELSSSGFYLNKLFDRALYVAKRVKTETSISRGNVSIGSVGVILAKKIFGDLTNRTVVLLGAGEMGELVLQYLRNEVVKDVFIVNRTLSKSQELEQNGLGIAVSFEEFSDTLKIADVLITSISGQMDGLGVDAMTSLMQRRNGEPLFVIDLGVPRNVSEKVGDINNLYLYNIDDLQGIAVENQDNRQASILDAKNIIDQEVKLFYENVLEFNALPSITQLGKKFEAIRVAELNKTLQRLKLEDTEVQAIDKLTQVLMNRVLHEPILTLKTKKEMAQPGVLDVFRKLFKLDDEG